MASNYYFMECCFEHQKTHIIEECDLMGCEGKHFQEYFIEKKDDRKRLARFYCLDRKQLGEYWRCAQIETETFCSEHCNNCKICFYFLKNFQELQESYFFSPRKDMDYQPIAWRVFFKQPKYYIDFRLEIAKTVKSDKLCH